jgi:hypothetical protein
MHISNYVILCVKVGSEHPKCQAKQILLIICVTINEDCCAGPHKHCTDMLNYTATYELDGTGSGLCFALAVLKSWVLLSDIKLFILYLFNEDAL